MLCERALRGERGRIEKNLGREEIVSTTPARPGADVVSTIDIELQKKIEDAFRMVEFVDNNKQVYERHEMHGAAVVSTIDIELQKKIEDAFRMVEFVDNNKQVYERHEM